MTSKSFCNTTAFPGFSWWEFYHLQYVIEITAMGITPTYKVYQQGILRLFNTTYLSTFGYLYKITHLIHKILIVIYLNIKMR